MLILSCPHCGKPIDRQATQFAQGPRHRYPELVQEGLGFLWTGPGWNDFDPALIRGTQKFLKKHDLPAEVGDAVNAARSKILQRQYGWLVQRHDEGQDKPETAKPETPMPRAADPADAPSPGDPGYFKWLESRRGG